MSRDKSGDERGMSSCSIGAVTNDSTQGATGRVYHRAGQRSQNAETQWAKEAQTSREDCEGILSTRSRANAASSGNRSSVFCIVRS